MPSSNSPSIGSLLFFVVLERFCERVFWSEYPKNCSKTRSGKCCEDPFCKAYRVVASTYQDRQNYLNACSMYAQNFGFNPFLFNAPPIQRDIVVTAFGARVRTDYYGQKNEVIVFTVSDALLSIGQTIKMAKQPIPIHQDDKNYYIFIKICAEGFLKADAPSVPQLSVPVIVVEYAWKRVKWPNQNSKCTTYNHWILVLSSLCWWVHETTSCQA